MANVLHTLQIANNTFRSSTGHMITSSTVVIFTFDTISIHGFTNQAWVLVDFVIFDPKICGLVFWFFFANSFLLVWNEKNYWVSPNGTFGMQLEWGRNYPYFFILIEVLFHDSSKTGAELACNILRTIA
jgi:hypothetical protein